MSLLMDALKKAELAKRQGQVEGAGDSPVADITDGLTLEPISDSSTGAPVTAANLSPQALASHLEDIDTQYLAEAKEAAAARLKAQSAPAAPVMAIEPSAESQAGGSKSPRDRKSTRLNSSHSDRSRMPSSA